ncbi:MAG: hypothetical protein P8P30_10980 [Rickettsiales bacterium]|nr:hypothetical protein [Rickettsiales bacterium]
MTITYNTLSTAAYNTARYDFIKNMEESGNVSLTVYEDSVGIPTIGIGLNLQDSSNRSAVVEEISGLTGAALTALEADITSIINTYSSGNLTALQNDLNQSLISNGVNKNFAFINEGEVTSVFNEIITAYESGLDNNFSVAVPLSSERVTLLSLQYNSPSLIGPNLEDAINNGERAEAWYEIRYDSNGGNSASQGIANRRFAESETFQLYDDESNVSVNDAIQALQMYTEHKPDILTYEISYSIPANGTHNGVSGIESIQGELEAAKTTLISHYDLPANTSFDFLIDYIPEGSGDQEGTEDIVGDNQNNVIIAGAGNDTIEGGLGADILLGESGTDTFIFDSSTSFGQDTIIDNGGNIRIDGMNLSGTLTPTTDPDIWQMVHEGKMVYAQKVGGDLVLAVNDADPATASDKITLQDFNFLEGSYGLEFGEVPNPTSWSEGTTTAVSGTRFSVGLADGNDAAL